MTVEPAALTPKEFGARFKRSASWAYRQIAAGKVNTILLGTIMIPESEVERVLSEAKASRKAAGQLMKPGKTGRRSRGRRLPVANAGKKLRSDVIHRAGGDHASP